MRKRVNTCTAERSGHFQQLKIHQLANVKQCRMNLMMTAWQLKHGIQEVTPVKLHNNATVQ
jgi:hypothetical protein